MDKLMKSAGMKNSKTFHRKIFDKCLHFINDKSDYSKQFLILLGPRRCGKTYCLKQLKELDNKFIYYNFKSAKDENEKFDIIAKLYDSKDTVFLLDEITYINNLQGFFVDIDNEYSFNKNGNKIIMTGSQMFLTEHYSNISLSTQATEIYTSYLDFEEWLLWKNKISAYNEEYHPTKQDYLDYLFDMSKFTGITDNLKYIKSCIDETIKSEYYNCESIFHHLIKDNDNETILKILDVMYSNIIFLHKNNSYEKYLNYINELESFYNVLMKDNMKFKEFSNRIGDRLKFSYYSIRKMKGDEYRKIIVFLLQTDLATIVVSQENRDNVRSWLKGDIDYDIKEIFSMINVCVKHPHFYINFIMEILADYSNDKIKEFISASLLGSLFECSIRGLLTYVDFSNYQTEYYIYDSSGKTFREIDYMALRSNTLIEISSSPNHTHKHLEWFYKNVDIDKEYKYICLQDCEPCISNNVEVFNCYDYLLYLSRVNKSYLGYFYTFKQPVN